MAFIAVLTQITESTLPQAPLTPNALDLVLNAGIVAKIVLGLLAIFSIVSWGIILDKLRVFRRVGKETDDFMRLFQVRKGVKEILQASRQYPKNPFATVFKEAYWLFNKSENPASNPSFAGGVDLLREQKSKVEHTSDDLVRLFDSVANREVLSLEKNLVFLATTGSVSPFFGLFGTVCGNSTWIPERRSGAVIMKTISKTNVTSTREVTLISERLVYLPGFMSFSFRKGFD